MKKIIYLLFLISNQGLAGIIHDEEAWKEFENLKVYYHVYDGERISNKDKERLLKEGKLRKIDQSYECNNECRKNYEALAERMNSKNKGLDDTLNLTNYFPDLWNKEVSDVFIEDIYENIELTKIAGQVITTQPLSFRIGNQFYTNETWFEDFKDYYEDDIGYVLLPYSFPGITVKRKSGSKNGIWIPQLKRFVYFKTTSSILSNGLSSYLSEPMEGECPKNKPLYVVLDSVVLYDKSGNKKTKKDLEGMILTNIYKKGSEYIVHFLDGRGKPVKSNLIDGVTFWAGELLTWYGYDKFVTYVIPEKEILDSNGKLTVTSVVNYTYEGRTQFICPSKIEEPYYSKLRSGELKFSDLPKTMISTGSSEIKNIFYLCWGNSPVCRGPRK